MTCLRESRDFLSPQFCGVADCPSLDYHSQDVFRRLRDSDGVTDYNHDTLLNIRWSD